jgi:hypothetical protein
MSVQQQERAMRTLLEGIVRRDGETLIRRRFRQCQALKDNRPSGLEDDDLDAWVDAADKDEEAIARYPAESLGDVDLKLAVLIDRIRLFMEDNKAGAFDLILAMSAREDLRRLTEQSAIEPRCQSLGSAERSGGIEKGSAATERNPLYDEIMDLDSPIHEARGAVETLFILLETEGEQSQVGKSLGFVAMGLDRNVKDLEELFAQLHKAARGRVQS